MPRLILTELPSQTADLNCPSCHSSHTIVAHTDDHYVCLNCGWSRNLNESSGFWNAIAAFASALIVMLILI